MRWARRVGGTRRDIGKRQLRMCGEVVGVADGKIAETARAARRQRHDVLTARCVHWLSDRRPARRRGPAPTTRWALVPLIPNELTPATRPVSPPGHGVGSVGTAIGSCSAAMNGLSSLRWRWGGIAPCAKHQHDLDQTRHPGRRLEVADVRLDRPEQ